MSLCNQAKGVVYLGMFTCFNIMYFGPIELFLLSFVFLFLFVLSKNKSLDPE